MVPLVYCKYANSSCKDVNCFHQELHEIVEEETLRGPVIHRSRCTSAKRCCVSDGLVRCVSTEKGKSNGTNSD